MQGDPPSRASTRAEAVFLSYASEDGEAAQRICDALRAAGIEVWFDQSELRGGEAWDRRIRQQIHDSRLFIAVISANTEARDEGYFRREWKLAVDRTHDMAEHKAFLVPVVIDATPQRGAAVPEKFHELQWTRLRSGETSPAFVEQVRRLLVPEVSAARAAATPAGAGTVPTSAPSPHRPARLKPALWVSGAVLAALLAYVALDRLLPSKHSPPIQPAAKLADKRTIVLGDFQNTTGDAAFDGTLHQIAVVALGESPNFSVLSDARMAETLRLMVRAPDTKLTPDVVSEICERTVSAAAVEGSISRLGSKYVLSLRARNCRTGDLLEQEQATAASKEEVLQVLAQMAQRFAARGADLLPRMEKAPDMSAEITTPSLEAWRSYHAAMTTVLRRAAAVEGITLLKRAVELDPNFAMAYAVMGREYDGLGQLELGAQSISRAYEMRDRVSDRENLFITFNYYRTVPRNLELARQTLESWVQKYPGDTNAHGFLSGLTSPGTGHYDRAVEEGLKALELDPDFSIGYLNVAWAYVYLNRPSDAEALMRKAAARKIEVIEFSLLRYAIAFLRSDAAAMERETAQRKTSLEADGFFEHQEAFTLAYRGQLQEANRLSERAISLARQGGLPERAALFAGARAAWNALYGTSADAQTAVGAALSLFRGRDADYGPAFALAILQNSQAHKIAADLQKRYPQDTSVQFSYLPALQALAALNQGDPAKALDATQAAVAYELAVPGTAYFTGALFGALYPVYVRGLAYVRLGRPKEAAAEFQKILDHPGIMVNDPIGPFARLQLARALFASGDRAKSEAVYKDLLALWKDADPEIPTVKQAKAEYANLH
jgi:eukaryotic-like serine/threonine-protein kinase